MRGQWVGVLVVLAGTVGCDSGSCPEDYPVMRDGFCYRADGAAEDMDAGPSEEDAGGGADDAGDDPDGGGASDDAGRPLDAGVAQDAGRVDAALICTGTHPMVEGTRRYCAAGDCYCDDPDNCYPEPIAAGCCSGTVVCGDADAGPAPDGGAVICTGTHPLVDGTRRYCEAGDCYCANPDNCYPQAIADACCAVAVVCE